MKKILLLSALSLYSFAMANKYTTPAVKTGEECVKVSENSELNGIDGFSSCSAQSWESVTLANKMKIDYKVVDNFIVVDVAAAVDGWIGFGIGNMSNSDMIIGLLNDKKFEVDDYFTSGRKVPVLDTKNGGKNNVLYYSGESANGLTKMRFVRELDTKDDKDTKLVVGESFRIIAAYGSSHNFTQHGGGGTASTTITLK